MQASQGQDEVASGSRPSIHGEVAWFIVIGIGAAAVDFLAYAALIGWGVYIPLAKGLSFVVAAATAYIGNKHLTFRTAPRQRGAAGLFAGLYALTLCVNMLVNSAVLMMFDRDTPAITVIAWGAATLVSATCNFVGAKMGVFRNSQNATARSGASRLR